MPEASPLKWHLAHTTWFFEEFVLRRLEPEFRPFHARFGFLFNSYYETLGARQARAERGLLSRPTLAEVFAYREQVEERVLGVLARGIVAAEPIVELGCHHEQQHQELMLTDLLHLFSRNPLLPTYRRAEQSAADSLPSADPARMIEFEGGLVEVGASGSGFAFDNERPRHRVYLEPFAIAAKLVTNGDFEQFIRDGGYRRPTLWLDRGFARVAANGWDKPLYWRGVPGEFREFSLSGEQELVADSPVCHVNYYEADAFARWAGARLPREHEWEVAAREQPVSGNFVESFALRPRAAPAGTAKVTQCYGDTWEWTSSSYSAYPGYKAPQGALGEYNGKFMSSQFVLRGGSCATPRSHIRSSYRNFFYPADRWQFGGIRLARDAIASAGA